MFTRKLSNRCLIHHLIAVAFCCCLLLTAKGQNNFQQVSNLFNDYNSKHFQEKIYAHTDKNFYIAGEILWFKLYNVDASFNKPCTLSKVAYVELLDANNKPALQAKVALSEGLGSGSFFIPASIASGNYSLRAYTNWMKNYSSDFYFSKAITVINTQQITKPANKTATTFFADFFPEGGNLVEGIESKVAFKVTNQYGNGVEFTGSIVRNNSDTITAIKPFRFGMGNFVFTPGNGNYKAVIKTASGETIVKELPTIYSSGYVITVAEKSSTITVQVKANAGSNEQVYLFAQTRQIIKKVEAATLVNGAALFTLNQEDLGEGIVQLTLFNHLKQPVCERLLFIQPKQLLHINATTDKASYTTRSRVNVSLQNTGENVSTANGSVAVYHIDSLQTLDKSSIYAYLWLSADLGGRIESPESYFDGNPNNEEAIDNLMLTNGWRRFKWDEIYKNEQPAFTFAPEYNGHIITGKIVDTRSNEPTKDIFGYASVPGTKTQFVPAKSDGNGIVRFEMKNMFGSKELIAQTNYLKDSAYKIEIDNPFSEAYPQSINAPFSLPVNNSNTLIDQSVNAQVQNIYSNQKLRAFTYPAMDTTVFYLKPELHYNLDDYTRFTTLEEVLREYVQFVDVRRRGNNYYLLVFDAASSQKHDKDPLFLLDGVPVFNMTKALEIDPLKIKTLDVVTPNYFYGSAEFPGIINLVSYNGDLANYELDPHAVVLDYEGLQLQRTFYSPQYNTDANDAHLPDFRNVLYWNPQVKINAVNNNNFSFFTSDVTGKYAMVIQALAADGKCGSSVTFFEVK